MDSIIAIGELLVEFIPVNPVLNIHEEGEIIKTASGSSGIFACATARFGESSAFIGKIGCDSLSRFACETIARQGVDLSQVAVSEEGQIGLSFVEYTETGRNFQFYRKNSVGSLFGPQDVEESFIRAAAGIHYSGMLLEVSESMREAIYKCIRIAKEQGILVSFDPNIRKEVSNSEQARKRLMEAVESADIIAPSFDEAQFITGRSDPLEIIQELHARGPKVVALTRDKDGAIVSCGGKVALASGIDVPVVDPTGAGDTFAAMLLCGVRKGWDAQKLALYCNCAGTMVVMGRGAIGRAIPTMEQVEEFARKGICTVKLIQPQCCSC